MTTETKTTVTATEVLNSEFDSQKKGLTLAAYVRQVWPEGTDTDEGRKAVGNALHSETLTPALAERRDAMLIVNKDGEAKLRSRYKSGTVLKKGAVTLAVGNKGLSLYAAVMAEATARRKKGGNKPTRKVKLIRGIAGMVRTMTIAELVELTAHIVKKYGAEKDAA
jgi:hypothetical protein